MTSSDDAANPTGTDDRDLATTSAAPAFAEQADDLVVRLEAMHRADALELAAEVRRLADRFRRWATERPAMSERVTSIQSLLELTRRGNELLTHPEVHPPQEPAGGSLLARLLSSKSR